MLKLTRSQSDVLACIFRLLEDNDIARTTEIARRLGLSKSRVVQVLKELASMNLIVYNKYRGAKLTKLGEKIAAEIVRKHRLIEKFLVDKLGVDVIKAHQIAHELEHSLDDISILLKSYKGDNRCPHGNPINPEEKLLDKRLDELEEGSCGIISRISNESKTFLQTLLEHSIWIGKEIKLVMKTPKALFVIINGHDFVLPREFGKYIYVKVRNND